MPPTIQTEAAKKALRQSTLTGQRHSLSQTGAQTGRPKPSKEDTLPTTEEAMQFLTKNDYHKENASMTVAKLGEIILTICGKAKKEEHKYTIEAMQNIGVLVIQMGKETAKFVARGKKVDEAITELKEELAKTTEGQKQETEAAKEVAKEAKEMMDKFTKGMETMTEKMKTMEETLKNRPQQAPVQTTATYTTGRPTYAATAAMGISIQNHARVMARGEEAERQVVVTAKDRNKEAAAGLKTEAELIAKADMTIKLMEEAGEKPPARTHVKFVGGFRAKTGAIIYILNSKEAANWLKHTDRLKMFNEKFGDSAQTHAKLFNLIAYYVPTTFDAESQFARTAVELDNDLNTNGLVHTKYIKPPHKRSKTQKSAHLILGFAKREDANDAIAKGWLIIEDKKVAVKKLTAEPRRCYKCQSVKGDHTADKCPEKEPKCARCADEHLTEHCDKPENIRCANCKSTDHGAGNRECPAFIQSVNEHKQRSPDGLYRFYPILGDTRSTELLDGSYGPDFTKAGYSNEDAERQNPSHSQNETNNGVARKPPGRLKPVIDWGLQVEGSEGGETELTEEDDILGLRPKFSFF